MRLTKIASLKFQSIARKLPDLPFKKIAQEKSTSELFSLDEAGKSLVFKFNDSYYNQEMDNCIGLA